MKTASNMKNKVIALLIKHGHTEEFALMAVANNFEWAIKAYPEANASFLANVCISV